MAETDQADADTGDEDGVGREKAGLGRPRRPRGAV